MNAYGRNNTSLPSNRFSYDFSLTKKNLSTLKQQALTKNIFVTRIGYIFNSMFFWKKVLSSDLLFLAYALEGEAIYEINKISFTLKRNQYTVLPANKVQNFFVSPTEKSSIYFTFISGHPIQLKNLKHYLMKGTKDNPQTTPYLSGRILQFDDILHHLKLSNNLENLIYANSRFNSFLCSFRLSILYPKNKPKSDPVIHTIDYMHDHIHDQIVLKDLAEKAGVSVSHYCATFKKKTMQSPVHLFNTMKIQKASQLLINTQDSVKSICFELNFKDPYYFSRLFKKITGFSPREFRIKNQKNQTPHQ